MTPNVLRWPMPAALVAALTLLAVAASPERARGDAADSARAAVVRVVTDAAGSRLQVDGADFFVRGMNWDYIPIGHNYQFDLFQQPEDVIVEGLDREMGLLKGMGVNTIRVYAGMPPRWVRFIFERYGIHTIVNHPMARYGFTLDGVWRPVVDYSDPRMRAAIAADVAATLEPYHGTPGILLYLLGNENNYGLSWSSFEIEALPKGERDAARARHLYSLFGEIGRATKRRMPDVPVAICNGDVQYIDLIAEECQGIDVFGTNVYRGISVRDLYQVVRDKLGVPVLFTEFGCDAFNARTMREDQPMQARYLVGQWREIYEQSSGHGGVGNAIGGCIFQWSDGWWKFGQDKRLDIHDTNASWPNGGYVEDFEEGENNMNEEWWGLCAKGPTDARGLYELYPRAAYYAMRRAWALDPYDPATDRERIRAHFAGVTPAEAALEARGDRASLLGDLSERARLSGVRMNFETFSTGGRFVTTPGDGALGGVSPAFRGFDHLQSFYADFQARPTPAVNANVSLHVAGNVPGNPIDQLFYENRALVRGVETDSGTVRAPLDRVKVYRASVSWDDRWFALDGFYRSGHYHWGYEGDWFGLYREAHYGGSIDLYNADAPVGVEVAAKRSLDGLKLAFGPQLWWGAPPTVLAKYRRMIGRFDATAVVQRDLPTRGDFADVGTSITVVKPTTKVALHAKTTRGPLTIEGGGIWAGANRVGDPFPVAERDGAGWRFLRDEVRPGDAFGGKLGLAGAHGRLLWYAQGAVMGLVAEGGPTGTTTYTGWRLKDTGLGNQTNAIGGFVYGLGPLQVGPNFLWQKPIVGPIPPEARAAEGLWRDNVKDPFSVRGNREMTAGELLLTWDPTPATWFHAWDNDVREDARLAASLGFVYQHMPTSMDPAIGRFSEKEAELYGTDYYVFAGATPPRDLWGLHLRAVSRASARTRVVVHAYVATGEPTLSDDPRLLQRSGGDLRLVHGPATLATYLKFNDWGPYDYHRDFNLTYPQQRIADLSYSLGPAQWFDDIAQTRLGLRVTWRSLDEHSPRYTGRALDPVTNRYVRTGDPSGNEWEVRTYLRVAL